MAVWVYIRSTLSEVFNGKMVINNPYTLSVVLGFVAGALGLAAWGFSRQRNLPPGPSLLRLIVATVWERGDTAKVATWMKREYGEVVSFYEGPHFYRLIVMLNSPKKIREVFVERNQDFARRPRTSISDILDVNDDIILTQHDPSVQNNYRHFFSRAIKNHVLNISSPENKLETEIQKAVDYLRDHSGEEIDPIKLFQQTLAAVFSSMVFSTTYSLGDPKLDQIIKMAAHVNTIIAVQDGTMIEMFPQWLSRLVYSRHIAIMQKTFKWFRDWARQEIKEHRKSLDPSNPRDLTDVYLLNRTDDSVGQQKIVDSFLAIITVTIQGIGNLMGFILMYIISHPEVQNRLHVELENVVARTSKPTLKHRKELPYLRAVILETMRCCDFTPSSFPHCAFEDTTLDGYHIPKDAWIVGNFSTIYSDPEIFPNPAKFDPNRFLDADGKLSNLEYFFPHSIGTRSCLGQPLVNSVTVLMIANMLHQFTFSFPASASRPSLKKSEQTIFLAWPEPYSVIVKPKKPSHIFE